MPDPALTARTSVRLVQRVTGASRQQAAQVVYQVAVTVYNRVPDLDDRLSDWAYHVAEAALAMAGPAAPATATEGR